MKKIIFIVCVFLLSINIFANTDVTKQVEKIREEFTKINSEKKYKVETYDAPDGTAYTYYKKNGKLKKVIEFISLNSDTLVLTTEYYISNDKVFFVYDIFKEHEKKEEKRYYFDKDGTLIRYIENDKIYDKGNIPQKYEEQAESIPRDASYYLELDEIM